MLSLQSYWQTAKTVEPVPYSEFEKALAEGRVAEVLVSSTSVIRGRPRRGGLLISGGTALPLAGHPFA